MARTRWRQIARYLIWLPPIVLLCVSGTYPILPSGDRRNGTWRDPRELPADLAIYYLAALVIFRLARRLIRPRRAVTWQTHRNFSRNAFWSVAAAVAALNAILLGTGCLLGLELVDLPGLIVTAPLFISFALPPPVFRFAVSLVILAVSALTWGYIGGRVVGARAAWRAKLMEGLCSACGYNLTGNTSGVCPECGTKVSATSVGLNR